MLNILLIDNGDAHAARVDAVLVQRGHVVTRVADIDEAIGRLQAHAGAWDIVLLVIGDDHSRPWFTVLHNLQEAAWRGAMPEVPLFLCISEEYLGADFEFRIERLGARYVSEE